MTFGSDAFGALLIIICFALVSFLEVSFKTLTKDSPLQEVGSPSKSCNNTHTHAGTGMIPQCDNDSDDNEGDDVDSDDSVDSDDNDDDCTPENPCGDGQKCNPSNYGGVAAMCINLHLHRCRIYKLKYGDGSEDDDDSSEDDDDNSDGREGDDDDSEHNGHI